MKSPKRIKSLTYIPDSKEGRRKQRMVGIERGSKAERRGKRGDGGEREREESLKIQVVPAPEPAVSWVQHLRVCVCVAYMRMFVSVCVL